MNIFRKKLNKIKNLLDKINFIHDELKKTDRKTEDFQYSYKNPKVNLGQIQSSLNNQKREIASLSEVEFQVFSQFGDDGIIQWLVNYLDITTKTFVEFGVEKYIESNTRFLLFNNNWRGLVIDADVENIKYIKNDIVSYFFDLHSIAAFITKDNINDLINSKSIGDDLGLLSIDIDSNDYWIWLSLEKINPVIVISEYNAEFGLNPWTIPYQENFVWDKSNAPYYWGSSLLSLCDLADLKGYSFIGCNSQGNNAYFIRNDKMKGLKKLTCEEGFVRSKFSLSRDSNGNQFSDLQKRNMLVGKDVFNTRTNEIIRINAI